MKPTLLIAEDDPDMADLLAELARESGFAPHPVHRGDQAADLLRHGSFDALFTDLRLPPPDGLELLHLAHTLDPAMPVVMITGFATTQNAIDAFHDGVFDLITKPFDIDKARTVLQRIHDELAHRQRIEQLTTRLDQLELRDSAALAPVMQSRAMRAVMSMIEMVADADVPILLTGETGTGKGMLARFIHQTSPRRDGPYFSLNCASIASSLAESELFGHEKGAFTGASQRRKGLLELADGGTLLLDEINSAPPEIQVRLLQFLQERTLMRVGGQQQIQVDVRLICATNEPLDVLVEAGRFRADLYYRLKVFPINLPPLRERLDDIVPLAEQLVSRAAREHGRPVNGFTGEALAALRHYPWPGNVRELENVIQRAVILCREERIGPELLPAEAATARPPSHSGLLPGLDNDASLAEVERVWIEQMLVRCDGNKREAARRLGIDASTLHRKLRQS